jgi:hypothetical protein
MCAKQLTRLPSNGFKDKDGRSEKFCKPAHFQLPSSTNYASLSRCYHRDFFLLEVKYLELDSQDIEITEALPLRSSDNPPHTRFREVAATTRRGMEPDENHARFKVFTVVTILNMFFWVKTPCELAARGQRFGKACCLHLQGWRWESCCGVEYMCW